MSQWWSWALTAVGVTGLYFAGSRKRLGWAIGVGAQALWVAYGWVYGRNFRRWKARPGS